MPGDFLDSNVLLYLTSAGEPDRAGVTEQLLRGQPVVSVQVLNEFANVAHRKFRREWVDIRTLLDSLAPLLEVHRVTQVMHRDALRIAIRYKLHWWDSLLVAAALTIGCEIFYSEDMRSGLVVDDLLTIVNPFA